MNHAETWLATTFVNDTQLNAVIPAALVSNPGTGRVFVETGDPMGDIAPRRIGGAIFEIASPAPPPEGGVAEIVISHPPTSIGVGETALIHAWGNGPSIGRIKLDTPISWTTSDESFATVESASDSAGVPQVDFWATLRGVSQGMVTITAASGGKTSSSTISVGKPATSMSLSPAGATINATHCQSVQLTPVLRDEGGTLLDGRQALWSSSSSSAFVTETGLVFARDTGSATITASTGLITASAAITVTGHFPGRFACDDE
jgi:hypothetical protein